MNKTLLKWCVVGALVLILMAVSACVTWEWQTNRYGRQLAAQRANHAFDLANISNAGAALLRTEQGKRLALERELAINDEAHHKELHDAQKNQARLRDRLATSDLRLSVILDAAATNGFCSVQPGTPTSSLVHGNARAQLDPAHAQRIVGITDDGDRGLIALAACQAYTKSVSAPGIEGY